MAYIINQDICSGCHTCELFCPAGAIRMNFSKYQIDADKCVSCGICAAHCHNAAISDMDAAPEVIVPHEKVEKECDILVIGGGASGLVAAAKAAHAGKSVILLEKNFETGGSAYFGHMMRVHWSKWHEAAGIPDKREKLFRTFVKKTQGRCNNELARRLLDANVDLANWLIDSGNMEKGFKWGVNRMGQPDIQDNFLQTNYPYEIDHLRSDPSCGPGESGWAICNILTDAIKEYGGEILVHTTAKKLIQDETGAVVGAIAEDKGGEVEVRAKAVIVCAGSYSRNKEIMDKMQPIFYDNEGKEPIHIYACATCTGDGITMCEEIGAHIDYVNKRAAMFGPMHHPFSYGVLSLTRGGTTVQVNKYGHPMPPMGGMTEIGALVNEPGWICWEITDQQSFDEAVANGINSSDPDTRRAFRHWERDLNNEIRDGSTIKADTLEELADKLGFDKEVFLSYIEKHNQDIREGKVMSPFGPPPAGDMEGDGPMMPPPGMDGDDDDEGMMMPMGEMAPPHPLENGPFYAVFQKIFQENAVGGMTINENAAVVKPDGTPIPGLYACGDNTRGIMLPGDIGVQYIEGYLSAMTYAMCSGYLAVEKAMETI